MKFEGRRLLSQRARIGLLALIMAVFTVSDGRDGRVAFAQGNIDPTVAKARAEMNQGRYEEAENILKSAAVKSPAGDSALELGLLYQTLGRRAEAQALLAPIANLPVGPRTTGVEYARLGRAARALGQMKLANDAYILATERAPKDPAMETGFGELFLEGHDNANALKSFQAAIELDENFAPAELGLAETLIDENPPAATELARKALASDPVSVRAHLLLARIALDKSDRDAAKAEIALAKAISPTGLDTLALSGGLAYVENRQADFQADVDAALKINPHFGEAYRVPAELAASSYWFEEAVALNRRALAIDPDNVHIHAELGVQLLRTGDEAEARDHLETAFKTDPYDRSVYNLLTMMDGLDKFEVIRDGDLIIKLDSKEAPVMREFVGPLAHRALEQYEKKYQFTPKGPILIEMFPRHDDFAVRTVGLPGMLGALGACFGRVVTLDSPKARPPGDFNWEPTLWHELGHVITLQLSRQRVPRWLTEGISVYEEKLGQPDWGREGELTFAAAYGKGEIMSLRELNAAFTDPEKISLAYYEASLLAEHIVDTYGWPALRKLLVTYGEGKEGEAALQEGLAVSIDTLQAGFDKLLSAKYSAVVKAMAPVKELQVPDGNVGNVAAVAAAHPDSYPAQVALGQYLWKAGKTEDAYRALEHAAQLVPMATGPKSPHALMAQMALERNDRPRAITELEELLKSAHTDLDSARLLARQLEQTGGSAVRLVPVYELIAALDPFDAANHAALGRLKMRAGDAPAAAREFRAEIAAGPLDPAAAHSDLAESYIASGDRTQAKKEALAAMEIAPGYPRAQDLLLKLVQ
jgi:tetratricopeptide (TPR) repeat protein